MSDQRINSLEEQSESTPGGGLWRKMWRLHFLAGLIIAPALIWFAFTGLIVLYSDVINKASRSELHSVNPSSASREISLDTQLANVNAKFPELSFWSVTPSREATRSNLFLMGDPDGKPFNVFVNQYTGDVLGKVRSDKGLVSFANNTHGSFLPRQFTMPIPSLTGTFGEGPAFRTVEIGEVVVEIVAGWGLVLAVSGLYLWWPRKNSKKRLLVPRFRAGGRPMWRDMHASAGTFLSVGLIFFVVTGLPWATFWGNEFSTVASKVTPNAEGSYSWGDTGPPSEMPRVGDLTRYGVKIPWASGEDAVPSSGGGMVHSHSTGGEHDHGEDAVGSALPAPRVGLETVLKAARDEAMLPGFSITPPTDSKHDDGSMSFGTYVVVNPWPSSLGEQGALYLDQFSGKTLGKSNADTWGGIQRVAELGVQTHMGTQFGLINRIFLTAICLSVLYSITTAVVMWLRRRRKGTIGVPRRAVDASIQKSVGVTALILAVIYPLWGASALILLMADNFILKRRVNRAAAA